MSFNFILLWICDHWWRCIGHDVAYNHKKSSDWCKDKQILIFLFFFLISVTQHAATQTLTEPGFTGHHLSRQPPSVLRLLYPSSSLFACVCFLRHRPFSFVSFFLMYSCLVEESNLLFLSITKRNWSGNFPGDKSQLFRLPTTALNRWILDILFILFLPLPPSFLPGAGHPPAAIFTLQESLEKNKNMKVNVSYQTVFHENLTTSYFDWLD